MLGETDVEPFGGRNKELVQGTLLFHVEHLREMIKEVKDHFYGEGEFDGEVENLGEWQSVAAMGLSLKPLESDEQH